MFCFVFFYSNTISFTLKQEILEENNKLYRKTIRFISFMTVT